MLAPQGEIVRRHDPDRFLTALFAPPEKRDTLLLLYAFNHELARAREVASEPTIALIRLQWWREVVEGTMRRHEIAAPLGESLARGVLDRGELLGLIAAREIEADPAIPTLAEWKDWISGTSGRLAGAAARLLGAPADALERVRALGAAYGVAGALRNVTALARQGRCLLPEDVLVAHGLSPAAVVTAPREEKLVAVKEELASVGRAWLREGRARRLPRAAVPAALPAVLAAVDLRHPTSAPRPRGLGARLSVLKAGLTGRI